MFKVWVESLNGVKGWAFSYPIDVMHAAACVKSKPTPIKESEAKCLASEFQDLGYRATVSDSDS